MTTAWVAVTGKSISTGEKSSSSAIARSTAPLATKTRVRSESPGDLRNRCIDYLQDGA
jgi:hypothetical protein